MPHLCAFTGGPCRLDCEADYCRHLGDVENALNEEKKVSPEEMFNPISHPKHYASHPSGIECIEIVEHMGFNLGNVLKYIWRADLKADAVEDLRKARWYLDREIAKREAS